MRKGQNPAKFVSTVARPERITAAVLTYIPFQSGYYAESLDVLGACLDRCTMSWTAIDTMCLTMDPARGA